MTDIYPTKLTIRNLYCYRGEHTVNLGPTVYAVVAEADDNPNRSNWLGKSTFLMAFAFALVGWHSKKTDDEIVTEGEQEASVELTLSDGAVISRSKRIGKSVQIRFTPPDGKTCSQDKAVDEITRHTGVDADNFFEILFFRQGRMSEFVTAGAASRIEIVEGWLRQELEPVQRMFAAASGHFIAVKQQYDDAVSSKARITAELEAMAERDPEAPPDDSEKDLATTLAEIEAQTEAECQLLQNEMREAMGGDTSVKRWHELKAKAAEYEQIVAEGIETKSRLDETDPEVGTKLVERKADKLAKWKEAEAANTKYQTLRKAEFKFDGQCPVACDKCPSAQWVQSKATTPDAIAAARNARDDTAAAYELEARAERRLTDEARDRAALEAKVLELRAKATELLPLADEADALGDEPPQGSDYDELHQEWVTLNTYLVSIRQAIEKHAQLIEQLEKADAAIETALRNVQIASDALAIVGKGGVQRAIQELMLSGVEADANATLAANSIDLRVQVVWDQESKGLAKVCGACGTAFPTSQRIKVCDACGAERGPNVSQKLRYQLSNESGAAQDLAGFAIGLAAGRWLRAHRGVKLSTVWIDEPFGKLDPHHRKALGNSIATMLAQSFQSAFVVAHELATLYAMPGRITIKAGPTGSRLHDVG